MQEEWTRWTVGHEGLLIGDLAAPNPRRDDSRSPASPTVCKIRRDAGRACQETTLPEATMRLSVSVLSLAVAASLSPSCRSRVSSSNDDVKSALVALEGGFADAYLKRDTAFLSRTIADDYIGINPD